MPKKKLVPVVSKCVQRKKDTYETLTLAAEKAIHADPRWSNLETCVFAVWQEIGSDAEALADECHERMTNASRLESCLDADRMTTLVKSGGEKADEFVDELVKKYGYPAVAKLIGKYVKL